MNTKDKSLDTYSIAIWNVTLAEHTILPNKIIS